MRPVDTDAIQAEITRLEQKLREFDQQLDDIDDLEYRLPQLDEQRPRLEAEIEDTREGLAIKEAELETEVTELEDKAYTELLDLHKEANQLEFEFDRLEETITEIVEIEEQLDQRADLDNQREAIQAELTTQRTRIEQLETQAVEEFYQHMDTLLGLLEYKNIERSWLERRETQVREGRRTVDKTRFELHVVRSTASGPSTKTQLLTSARVSVR